jgi:DNA-binding CsgD family transcriptional regulator
VLQLVTEGLTSRGIGQRLGISEHTAKFHVNAILGKLGAQNRSEAVALAARLGILVL